MLLQKNGTVNTSYSGAPKLTGAKVFIDSPSPTDMPSFGGIVRYVILFEPGTDVVPGDMVYIQSFGANSVNPSKGYLVFQADPEGALGLEDIYCVVGEKVQR